MTRTPSSRPGLPDVPAQPLERGPACLPPRRTVAPLTAEIVPEEEAQGYDVHDASTALDAESFFEIKPLFAPELVVGFGLLDGTSVGIVANNPMHKGGVLFTDSADKAARFIWLADAFGVPLIFLADVPGFMIGSQVEREGIIRHGAKMITAVSEATVPKVSVIVRKAYGAGLYAMSGPAFRAGGDNRPPTAKIAVMGPEAAVNAVFANKIAAIEDPGMTAGVRGRAARDLRDRRRPAAVGLGAGDRRGRRVGGPALGRLASAAEGRGKDRTFSVRRHGVPRCDGSSGPPGRLSRCPGAGSAAGSTRRRR